MLKLSFLGANPMTLINVSDPTQNALLRYARDADAQARFDHELDVKTGPLFTQKAYECLIQVLEKPQEFPNPDLVIKGIFSKAISPNRFFARENFVYTQHILGLCTHDPRPETARAGALIMAEFIRCRTLGTETDGFELYPQELFKAGEFSLGQRYDRVKFHDLVIMIQNALVDLVRENDLSEPQIDGIQVLKMAAEGAADHEPYKFWTHKITQIKDLKHNSLLILPPWIDPFDIKYE